jgi:hypothetical protein
MQRLTPRVGVLLAGALVTGILSAVTPTAQATAPATADTDGMVYDTTFLINDDGPGGRRVLGTATTTQDATGKYTGDGSSGSHIFHERARSRGCRTATLIQKGRTLLGFHAWTLTMRQHYCWNKKRWLVSRASRSFDYDSDNFFDWKGWLYCQCHYYSLSGHRHAAHVQKRRGRIQNSVIIRGAGITQHPLSVIRVYRTGSVYYRWDH